MSINEENLLDVAPGVPHSNVFSETMAYVIGLALAFGVLVVFLVMIGTIWIMAHMNANMAPDPALMNLQMQH